MVVVDDDVGVEVGVLHVGIAARVLPAALVTGVVLLGGVGVGASVKVFVDALLVLVGAAPVGSGGDDIFVAGGHVLVLQSGRDECARLDKRKRPRLTKRCPDGERMDIIRLRMVPTYIIHHLIFRPDVLDLEKLLQRALLLTTMATVVSLPSTTRPFPFPTVVSRSPIDVAELLLARSSFEGHGDIKRPTGRDSTAHSGHGDAGDAVEGDVRGGLGDEHEALVEAEE